jgi:hypothetical protein
MDLVTAAVVADLLTTAEVATLSAGGEQLLGHAA